MAIQLDYTIQGGIVAENAYHRIERIQCGDSASQAVAVFKAYRTRDEHESGGQALPGEIQVAFEPDVSPDAPNYHAQAYLSAKADGRFSGAIDC